MTASADSAPTAFPGEIRQLGFVVADLEAAMTQWLSIGIGPWTVIHVDQRGAEYRGVLSDPSLDIGFSYSGGMQIELIQALDHEPSTWQDTRDAGRFGLHHLAYWSDDFDAVVRRASAAGLEVVQSGNANGTTRFIYFEDRTAGMLLELMELTDLTRTFMDDIRAFCEGWDGRGPAIRR